MLYCSNINSNNVKKIPKHKFEKLKEENKRLKQSLKNPDISKLKNKQILSEINNRGYFTVKKKLPQDVLYKISAPTHTFKVGVVSDPHVGSIYQQLTHLTHFYGECKKEGVKDVFLAGDMVEGNGRLYRGQQFEMFINGASNQVRYAVENYPKIKGITTRVVAGNHDFSFYKESGYDVVSEICDKRDDLEYLGVFGAYITIGKIRFYLMHGSSGNAYARSYKMQKIIEQFAPDNKPNILLLGHFHTSCYLPMYRNVDGFQLHCFQSQTPYLKAKGLYPEIGGLILTITENSKGIYKIIPDYHKYYIPIIKDY